MYKCDNCENYFDELKLSFETHNLRFPPFEKTAVCPTCESTNFHEIEEDEESEEVA